MIKKIVPISILFFFAVCFGGYIFAQDAGNEIIQGVIEEAAQDGSYIIINKQKINIADDLIDEVYFEAGDEVRIEVEKSAQGLQALDYEYIFDEGIVINDEDVIPNENYDLDYSE
ncbi:MAG: hypothetical protein ABIH08_07910 [Candidatus Omnitrophota bacterium]